MSLHFSPSSANPSNILDDFLEAIEHIPDEVRTKLDLLAERDTHFEESRKALFKKRNLYLRAEEKGLDLQMRNTLLKRTEREHQRLVHYLREKIEMESRLLGTVENRLLRLEREMISKLGYTSEDLTNPHAHCFDGGDHQHRPIDSSFSSGANLGRSHNVNLMANNASLPKSNASNQQSILSTSNLASNNIGIGGIGQSHHHNRQRRSTLQPNETIDPNEPIYCICRKVSYGDMIACDNPACPREWFHYPCLGLSTPPHGRWYCPECLSNKNNPNKEYLTRDSTNATPAALSQKDSDDKGADSYTELESHNELDSHNEHDSQLYSEDSQSE